MHTREEMISAFRDAARALHDFIASQPEDLFERGYGGKWSAGQHLDHMIRSVKPLNLAYRLPSWCLRLAFGKPKKRLCGAGRAVQNKTCKRRNCLGGLRTGYHPVIRQEKVTGRIQQAK